MRGKVILSMVVAGLVLGMVSMFASAGPNGNGAPSGFHENINIIGVKNPKSDNYSGGNGSTIFVDRTGSTQFYVQGGSSFQIVDHDGTDGFVGSGGKPTDSDYVPGLIFPYDATATPTWRVQIWVRLQGPKDSSVYWTTKYFDGSEWAYWSEFPLRKDTPSKFTEKTSQMLADGYENMLWVLDSKTNFRICQMRIYLLDGK